MSSIIKVDTVQDQDGNNIINENANTVTVGKSGDTVNIVGTITGFTSTGIDDNATSTAITINSSEQVEFTAGTALLPAITTTGDANTGMWFPAADTIAFSEGGSEVMRIDSSGNVLVGKTSANTATVGVEFRSFGLGAFTRSGNEPIIANRTDNDGKILQLQKDGTEVGSIGTAGGGALYISDAVYGGLAFSVLGAGDINPCNTTGGVRDNAMDLGQPTARFKDIYLGGGAYIGGTAAANKLDDYEEGTWTPGLSIASSGNSGTYTKVGNVVTAKFKVIPTASGTNVVITGFPFASNSDGEQQGGSREVESSGKFFFIRMAGSATEATIIRYDADVSITASMTFQGQITYLT